MELDGNWEEHKKKLKEKFLSLTNDVSFFSEEKKEELLNKYQYMLGKSRAELLEFFEGL